MDTVMTDKAKVLFRFESQQLSPNNMKRLVPILRRWCEDIEKDAERVQKLTSEAVENRRRAKKTTIDGETRRILVQGSK